MSRILANLLGHDSLSSWLKWLVAGQEMAALSRYQTACQEVLRWNASLKESSTTAEWIRQQGQGESSVSIGKFRLSLGFNETTPTSKSKD